MITWTILGSGTHIPSARRQSAGHLAVAGDTNLLVDCGPGSFHGLTRAGTSLEDLDACLLTHLHPDHIADLVPLLFRLRNVAKENGETRFQIFGPPGTVRYLNDLQRLHAPLLGQENLLLTVEEGLAGELRFPGCVVSCAPVAHGLPAVAYALQSDEGGKVAYSGDTGRSADLIRLAAGADLLVIEASFPNGDETPFHLTPAEAAQIAADAGVGAMILVHLNPECDEVDLAEQCGDVFSGEVMIGEDYLTHTVGVGGSP